MTLNVRRSIFPGCRIAPTLMVFGVIFMSLAGTAPAGDPEYLQLGAKPGMALEVDGVWDAANRVFIADDIEVLPKERLPKLRGEIEVLNKKDSLITMYGIPIRIYEHTEFIEDGAERSNFNSLKKGLRIEVSCKFGDSGEWKARKIKTRDVKKSNKIKGTITRVAIDGTSPDTLELSGLQILLVNETDIIEPSGDTRLIERELFPDVRLTEMTYPSSGRIIAPDLLLNAQYRQSLTFEKEYDLHDYFDSDSQETEPAVRLELTAYPSQIVQAFAQLRVRKRYYISSDRTYLPGRELEADITQLYILARNFGVRGLAAQVGRQDFDEDREWLYDDYLDAARLYYYGYKPLVLETAYIHAISPLKSEFKTWTDFLLQAHIYPNKDNHLSTYFITRSDTDIRNREPKWYGIRYKGELLNLISPWLEYSYMGGEDKGRTLKAGAFDIGATMQSKGTRFQPSVTLGYAVGSGDKVSGDNIDNRFRQTGYEDNVGYFGGVTSIHYYSEVIDPELSNMKILTVAAGARPTVNSSIDIIYHTLKQDYPKDELKGADLVDPIAVPYGLDDDLGWEIDAVFGINRIWNHVGLTWVLGIFSPGEAFDYPGSAADPSLKNAFLNRFNLKLEL